MYLIIFFIRKVRSALSDGNHLAHLQVRTNPSVLGKYHRNRKLKMFMGSTEEGSVARMPIDD